MAQYELWRDETLLVTLRHQKQLHALTENEKARALLSQGMAEIVDLLSERASYSQNVDYMSSVLDRLTEALA